MIISFLIGAILGFILSCIVIGSNISNREHDAYTQGLMDGRKGKI